MTNKQWNHQYFESIPAELPTNIFRSLEIEQYFQKTLKDNGFSLQNYKINLSKSVINILLSVCKLNQPRLKLNLSNESTEKISKYVNKRKSLKKLPIKRRYLQTAALCKNSRLKTETEKLKNIEFTNISNKLARSLKLFTKSKQNINITIKEINFVNANSNVKLALENLYKFRRAFFFKTGKRIITPFVTQRSSAKLIGKFTAEQLVAVKQQNFFFNFLKESLLVLVNQKFSKLQGVKVLVTGRINNSARSRTRKIEIGNVSLISKSSKIDYSESTAFTPNGTIGVKVWVSEK
jgi:ribosomal protein S3